MFSILIALRFFFLYKIATGAITQESHRLVVGGYDGIETSLCIANEE